MISFITELHEARMIFKQSDVRITFEEACERLYICILLLEFMSRIKQTKELAKKYADSTTSYYNYQNFRSNGTDMYNLMYFVTTDADNVAKIFNSADAAEKRKKTHLPLMALNGYLTGLGNPSNRDIYFIMRVEAFLNVTNTGSKEIRRLLSYQNPTQTDVQNTAYRILNEFRNKMPTFDLMSEIERKLTGPLTYDHSK
jgi:hypothetical protein